MKPSDWIEGAYDELLSRKDFFNVLYEKKNIGIHCNTRKKAFRFMKFIEGSGYGLDNNQIDTGIYEFGKDLCFYMELSGYRLCSSIEHCNERGASIIEYEDIDIEEAL